jgi:hypothetical protein
LIASTAPAARGLEASQGWPGHDAASWSVRIREEEPMHIHPRADTAPATFPDPAEFWARLGLPAFGEGATALGQAWMQEMMRFLAGRLRADADALVALCDCKGPMEVAEVHQRWLVGMGEAYAGAGARLMRLAMPDVADVVRRPGDGGTSRGS